MTNFNTLISKVQRRNKQFRNRLEKMMVKAANSRDIPILYDDIMVVSRQKDLTAAAAILPCHTTKRDYFQEFAFLYLDLEEMAGLKPGFYILRVFEDAEDGYLEQAHLTDLRRSFVRTCRFMLKDPYEPILGQKPAPTSRNTLIDSWIRRGEAYAIEGVLGNGTPFVVTMEF